MKLLFPSLNSKYFYDTFRVSYCSSRFNKMTHRKKIIILFALLEKTNQGETGSGNFRVSSIYQHASHRH